MLQWQVFSSCVHHLLTENWWSVLEPPLFLKIVELYKDVVVHLLKLCKIGIPASERRILTNFLHTAFRVLEILHRVCLHNFNQLFICFCQRLCAVQLLKEVKLLKSLNRLASTELSVVFPSGPMNHWNSGFQSDMVMELTVLLGTQADPVNCICEGMLERAAF